MTKIKDGDLYSYATMHLEAYGFLIRTNEDFMYKVTLDDILGVELQIGSDGNGYSLNIRVQPENIGKVISDPRGQSHSSYILVYRSGKSREEILELIRPGIVELLEQRFKVYQELTANVSEMLDFARADKFDTDYLCSSHPQSKNKNA